MNDITKIAIYCIKRWFKFELTPYQKKIVEMVFSNHKRSTIRATTRYGKSQILALALIMYAILIDNKRIGIIAPTHEKTKYIMSYILHALSSCEQMNNIVDLDLMELSKLERLKREVSKKKITFKNGSSISILTADVKGKGFSLMGAGFDLTAVDETAELTLEVYSKIYRMLVEHKDAKIVEIGNPWHLNHFYDHHNSEDWDKLHIDWKIAVKEGRMTEVAVEDQRKNLTELEFEVLFNANFPENVENSIFKKEYTDLSVRQKDIPSDCKILIGVDVATSGKDSSVITIIGEKDNEFYFIDYKKLNTSDTMNLVGEVRVIADNYKKPIIQIDVIGLGKGVYDRLREYKYDVYEYVAGRSPLDKKRYMMRKTEDLFGLADIMKQGRFYNLPNNSPYILEMRKEIFEVRSDRLLKHIDPEDKSPDHLDSLLYAMSVPRGRLIALDLKTL